MDRTSIHVRYAAPRMPECEIQKWASPETLRRMDDLRVRQMLQSDPNFVFCSNAECDAGQVHTSGTESPIMTCANCGARTCSKHRMRWHEDLSCDEFDHPEAADERDRQGAPELEAIRQKEEVILQQIQADEHLARAIRAMEEGREVEQRDIRQERGKPHREKEGASEHARREARAEQIKRRKEERQGAAEVRRSSKPCPGAGCLYRVDRISGCKHMTCPLGVDRRKDI
ncbi:hypothetical protein ASPCAL03725 [Aspergillus calidoustus]|uniref:IBR domain-containing protein n=1 Tax=Aspergillus calidoustus TaxID=454130 RepID=A0A0U5FVC8_ASPCI|nr:hypothetical protein ASPCAL03725 [Aspergillus calidoustus]